MSMIPEDLRDLLPTRKAAHSEPDDRPTCYLWVYDPQEAKAYVEEGNGDHPAHFPVHDEIAPEVTHPDRRQGYAFSIVGGWRIMDEDFHRVEDPYLVRVVLAALQQEHPAPALPMIRYHGDPNRHH